MESKTMLLGYGAKNCWCFKDWFDVDLRLNGYVPKEISQNNDFSCLMAFEGANASGKTNGLKVLSFFVDFVKNSFSYSPKQEIYFDSFFSNKENTEFYIEFKIDDTEYRYEAIDRKSVV